MNNTEFNEKALYQFALDVNEFGPKVAAELLIKLMKSYHSESKAYNGTGSDYLDCFLGIGGFSSYGPLNGRSATEESE